MLMAILELWGNSMKKNINILFVVFVLMFSLSSMSFAIGLDDSEQLSIDDEFTLYNDLLSAVIKEFPTPITPLKYSLVWDFGILSCWILVPETRIISPNVAALTLSVWALTISRSVDIINENLITFINFISIILQKRKAF